MRRRWLTQGVAAGICGCAVAVLPLLPASPAAARTAGLAPASAAPRIVGTFHVSAPLMPRTAWIRGRALKFTIDVSQTSRFRVAVSMYLDLWAWTNPGFQQTRGIKVSWRDPVTGRWDKPYSIIRNGTWYLGPTDTSLVLTRDHVVRIPVRIWFGAGARAGTYNLTPGVAWYEVFNARGQSIPAVLTNTPPNGYTYRVRVR